VNLVKEIQHLGVEGRVVLVHTGLRSVGDVDAKNYVNDWRDAVTDDGLLLIPTFTGKPTDLPERPPTFDVSTSKPVNIGIVPVIASQMEGGFRSVHATHSVKGFGNSAADFLNDHFDSYTPCDEHSPFRKLAEHEGLIALVGCTHTSNTTIHAAEKQANVPYHLIPGEGTSIVIDREGNRLEQRTRFHSWATERDFMRIDKDLGALGIQTYHSLGDAIVRLIDAKLMMDWLVQRLRAYPYLLCKPKGRGS
jgi:aminoglycoside 3-N-acetyltransferase